MAPCLLFLDHTKVDIRICSFISEYPITRRLVRNDAGNETCFQGPQHFFEDKQFVQLEIPKGTLVLIHGSVVHQSGPNLSEDPRNAYTFHVIEGDSQYDNQNWLQPPERGFARVY